MGGVENEETLEKTLCVLEASLYWREKVKINKNWLIYLIRGYGLSYNCIAWAHN